MTTDSKNTTVAPVAIAGAEMSNVTGGFSVKAVFAGAIGGWRMSHEFYENPSWMDIGRGMVHMYKYADGGYAPTAAAQPTAPVKK